MATVRGILFDLDNTLVHREASIRRYAEVFYGEFGHMLSAISVECIAERLILADSGGYRQKQDMLGKICSWPEWQSPPDMEYINRHWMWEFPPLAVPMDDMTVTLDALVSKDIKLGIITNGSTRMQNGKIMALHLWRHCPVILVSESVGLRKPDSRLFALVLDQLGLSPDEVWFVGDHPEFDIIGAERAGLTGIWMTGFHRWPDDWPEPVVRIEKLSEILNLIGEGG